MKNIFISVFVGCVGLLMGMWDTQNVMIHAIGVCGLIPLAFGILFLPMIMGSDTRDGWLVKKADREKFRIEVAGDLTKQEEAAYLAREDANYVANMAGFAQHREGYDASGTVLIWKDVVTDQHGHEHVVRGGYHWVGTSPWSTPKVEAEPVEYLESEVLDDVRYNVKQLKRG